MNSDSKSIFLSATFWGLVVGIASQIAARYGIHFPDDSAGIVNDLVTLVGSGVSLWGRFRATTPLHIVPPKNNQGGFVRLELLVALAVAFSLFACTSAPVQQNAQRTVYGVRAAYQAALEIAVAYKRLPACGQPGSPVLCSDQAIVAKLQAADNCAFAVLTVAEAASRDLPIAIAAPTDCGDASVNEAIAAAGSSMPALLAAAQQAVALFAAITAQIGAKT